MSYYDEHAEEYCAATIDADMSFCRDKFMACLPAGAHILDAGCGSGRDSKAFMDNGFAVTAMDASEKMCTEAKKLLRQDVLQISFEKMNFQNEFDGIWACASLLHVAKNWSYVKI
ncbi:MAG: class I SAM-dependent methyltransferase [Clostridiales bacterium]|nr:class I SAM-dependent methyltransferase [Clostridiales bacterium]